MNSMIVSKTKYLATTAGLSVLLGLCNACGIERSRLNPLDPQNVTDPQVRNLRVTCNPASCNDYHFVDVDFPHGLSVMANLNVNTVIVSPVPPDAPCYSGNIYWGLSPSHLPGAASGTFAHVTLLAGVTYSFRFTPAIKDYYNRPFLETTLTYRLPNYGSSGPVTLNVSPNPAAAGTRPTFSWSQPQEYSGQGIKVDRQGGGTYWNSGKVLGTGTFSIQYPATGATVLTSGAYDVSLLLYDLCGNLVQTLTTTGAFTVP